MGKYFRLFRKSVEEAIERRELENFRESLLGSSAFRSSNVKEKPKVLFKKIKEGATIPYKATPGAAGLDLVFWGGDGPVTLKSGERHVFPTSVEVCIPEGFEGQVRPRSGLASMYGITVLNSPGTIDSDYRGEIKVILVNHGKPDVTLPQGCRIAQLVISPVAGVDAVEAEQLGHTERGSDGFGSTGK